MFNKSIFVVLALVISAVFVRAQDEPVKVCDVAAGEAFVQAMTDNLALLKTDVNAALVGMRGAIDTYQLSCTAGVFNQVSHPGRIIGPVKFEGTVYQLTLALPKQEMTFGSVEWTALSGDCGSIPILSLSGIDGGSETDILEFEGCEALFEVNVTGTDEWTLTITKVK